MCRAAKEAGAPHREYIYRRSALFHGTARNGTERNGIFRGIILRNELKFLDTIRTISYTKYVILRFGFDSLTSFPDIANTQFYLFSILYAILLSSRDFAR